MDLTEHITQNHKKIFGCCLCQSRELSILAAREHFRTAHTDRNFKCHKCQESFQNMIEVHSHISSIHEDFVGMIKDAQEEYSCTMCSSAFKTGKFAIIFIIINFKNNVCLQLAGALIHHIRSCHLSVNQEVSKETYEAIAKEFGDHVIEYDEEQSDNTYQIHSIL